jgi:penicillin-binding protein 1A
VNENRKPAERARQAIRRLGGTAVAFTRERYGRARAYLMAHPPRKRAVLMVLWGGAAVVGLLLAYVLLLIPLTPGSKDLKQARSAKASTLMSADGKQLASFDQGLHESVKLDQILRPLGH